MDFSNESLQHVEGLLDEASDFAPEMPEEVVDGIIQKLGSYVLEVGRRQFGGKYYWHQDEPVLVVGEPEFKIAMKAWGKVKGRLSGDSADNIPFFFKGFHDRVRDAKPGDDVLYV